MVGTLLVLQAFSIGAEATRLVPLYNVNTLFAVILAIFIFSELPDPQNLIKVVAGAILIIIGSILVTS